MSVAALCPSEAAEAVFARLKEDGLKDQNHAPAVDRVTNLDHLDWEGVVHKNVGVRVDIQIARDKDQTLPHRVQLTQQVRDILEEEFLTIPWIRKNSTTTTPLLLLCVRIVLLSDGSSKGARRYTTHTGTAKLTLAYCLQSVKSGRVGFANQLYEKEDCTSADLDTYWEYSSAIVRSMARKMAKEIGNEVANRLDEITDHKAESDKQIAAIEVKLANEENLEPEEYNLASEKHLL
jgi:hypothetical protein